MTDDVDRNRRHFLTVATAVTGGAGIALASIPFLSSLKPSARAQALGAPVEVPVGTLEPGAMVRVVWRGRLVFIVRRDEQMLERLSKIDDLLRDPTPEVAEQQPEYATRTEYSSGAAGIPRGRGLLHPPGLRAAGRIRRAAFGELVRGLFLPVPRFAIRSGGPCL
ncbi:MAG: ubiquinol-cytochrome c reductase iron-sulfur subunit N-terminal domain-containing protein [Woeseiaceae bacterium]|nr:ubiquinol-cytochrome c reductase iron-sulfur subunit N-terminal domain-containing protein [Woeseiaceae bacterium]